MAPPRTYSSPGAFRKALEERLKKASQSDQIDLNRLRRHVSFDRLLARLFRANTPPWVLKGGYALELRFKAARSTVDIDLTVQRVPAGAGESVTGIVRQSVWRGSIRWKAPTFFCGDSTSESSTLSSECRLKKRGQPSGAPAGRT
jgi:hypothetical protein